MKFIIGMLTIPIDPIKTDYFKLGNSFISKIHLEFLNDNNIIILPIPYNTTKYNYFINKINGLYIPADTLFSCDSDIFNQTCTNFIKLGIKKNNNGEYFPIYGVCKGIQQMLVSIEENNNQKILDKFDSFNSLYIPLTITKTGYKSKIFKNAPKQFLNKLITEDITRHNHNFGLSPTQFLKSKNLREFYNIVGINYDRKNQPFISIIESYNYPFYGIQFHPESGRDQEYFAEFLKNEYKKNKKEYDINKNDLLKINYNINHDENTDYCNYVFFIHE
jgi:gamma-glutamyl hydrolase